jgi:aerobic-type carbon monoxide dehydrogenase small subunit (CoxS/CutS family)
MAQTAVCNRYHSIEQQLCRCGSHNRIVRAVLRAAAAMKP